MGNRVQETLLYPLQKFVRNHQTSFGQAFGLYIVTIPERDFRYPGELVFQLDK